MKTKHILLIGIAIMAVGGAAATARADGFSFSISVGSPLHHVQVAHHVPPFIPVPRVVVQTPRVFVPVPQVVVAGPRAYHPVHCATPAPRVVVRHPVHYRGYGHHVHQAKAHGKKYKHGGLYYGNRGNSRHHR